MNLATAQRQILLLGIEDYSGLWEIVWQLHTSAPELPSDRVADLALRATDELVDQGLLKLYRCREPYGELSAVAPSEARDLLQQPASWTEPVRGGESLRFETTAGGEAVYRRSASRE